jgi:hypothetical protein
MRWTGHVARRGERRSVYKFSDGKPEGESPHGRPRLRWEDNNKIQEVRCRGMEWIELAHNRESWRALVTAVKNFHGPQNMEKFLTS